MNIRLNPFAKATAVGTFLLIGTSLISMLFTRAMIEMPVDGETFTGPPTEIIALQALACLLPMLVGILTGILYAYWHKREADDITFEHGALGGIASATLSGVLGSIVGQIIAFTALSSMMPEMSGIGADAVPAMGIAMGISLVFNLIATIVRSVIMGGVGGGLGAAILANKT